MTVECPFCEAKAELERAIDSDVEIFACETCLNPFLISPSGPRVSIEAIPDSGDVRLYMRPDSLGGKVFRKFRESIFNLPILPEIAQRVLALANAPDSSLEDLSDVINEDAVIASKVLQVANSAYYGGLTEIGDVRGACVRLGLRAVVNTVQTIAHGQMFSANNTESESLMRDLWQHAVATAYLSGSIANLVSMPRAELAYLGGLVHDIGKIALLDLIGGAIDGEEDELHRNPELMSDFISRYHPLAGLHIALRWNLPPDLAAVVYWHTVPEDAPTEQWRRLCHNVSFANAVAHVSGFPSEYTQDVALLTHPSAARLALTDIKIATLRVDLGDRMEQLLEAVAV